MKKKKERREGEKRGQAGENRKKEKERSIYYYPGSANSLRNRKKYIYNTIKSARHANVLNNLGLNFEN